MSRRMLPPWPLCVRCGAETVPARQWRKMPEEERQGRKRSGACGCCNACYQWKLRNEVNVPQPNPPEVVARLRQLVGL